MECVFSQARNWLDVLEELKPCEEFLASEYSHCRMYSVLGINCRYSGLVSFSNLQPFFVLVPSKTKLYEALYNETIDNSFVRIWPEMALQ